MFSKFLEAYVRRFSEQGSFHLRRGSPYKVVGVPEAPGIYLIYGRTGHQTELLYIGKSGTIGADGTFGEQMLYTRLAKGKQDGLPRRIWCPMVIQELGLDSLEFHWFVTFSKEVMVLPAKAEADLLQAFFEEYSRLPAKNRGF